MLFMRNTQSAVVARMVRPARARNSLSPRGGATVAGAPQVCAVDAIELQLKVKLLSEHRAVVAARGRVNAATVLAMKARIRELVDGGRTEIVCDLTEVVLLDSSGLSALVAGLKATSESAGYLKLVGLNPQVASIFKLTMLDHIFEIYPTVEACLREAHPQRRRARAFRPTRVGAGPWGRPAVVARPPGAPSGLEVMSPGRRSSEVRARPRTVPGTLPGAMAGPWRAAACAGRDGEGSRPAAGVGVLGDPPEVAYRFLPEWATVDIAAQLSR
ncbi:MAG TPA: STAS domain-containing protein [Anaeromyxobacteraceae bacterium]|nr:STAS domain-containing protein [Anaeromyxobacteraceae bacterium]